MASTLLVFLQTRVTPRVSTPGPAPGGWQRNMVACRGSPGRYLKANLADHEGYWVMGVGHSAFLSGGWDLGMRSSGRSWGDPVWWEVSTGLGGLRPQGHGESDVGKSVSLLGQGFGSGCTEVGSGRGLMRTRA